MFRKSRFGVLCFAALAVFSGSGLAQDGKSYEVRGRWSNNPGEEVHLGYFPTREAAQAFIDEAIHTHRKGGVLEFDPKGKPVGWHILPPTRGDTWKKAQAEQSRLQQEKERLDREFSLLKELGADLTRLKNEVAEIRRAIAKLQALMKTGGGPFVVKFIAYDPPARTFGKYSTVDEARSALAGL
jgi:hypothetical protein